MKTLFVAAITCIGLIAHSGYAAVFLGDTANSEIDVYDNAGALLYSFPMPGPVNNRMGLAHTGTSLLFASDTDDRIYETDLAGTLIRDFASPVSIDSLEGLGFGPDETGPQIFVLDGNNDAIVKIDPVTEALTGIINTGQDDVFGALDVDPGTGNVYADLFFGTDIGKYNPDNGAILGSLDNPAASDNAIGIGFDDGTGNLFVADGSTVWEISASTGSVVNSFAAAGGYGVAVGAHDPAVPEPGTLALMGLAASGFFYRRKQKRD